MFKYGRDIRKIKMGSLLMKHPLCNYLLMMKYDRFQNRRKKESKLKKHHLCSFIRIFAIIGSEAETTIFHPMQTEVE